MRPDKKMYDDEYEALSMMISNSNREFKEVACFLYPRLKPESAYARLKACLNPDKDERLTFGEIIAAMNFCERFDPLFHACDETMHARPDRKAPDDERVKLTTALNSAMHEVHRMLARLETLQRREGGES